MRNAKHRYTAGFSTNGGSTFHRGMEFSSRREAIRHMRKICLANTFAGSSGHVWVLDESGDEVYSGAVRG